MECPCEKLTGFDVIFFRMYDFTVPTVETMKHNIAFLNEQSTCLFIILCLLNFSSKMISFFFFALHFRVRSLPTFGMCVLSSPTFLPSRS